MSASKVNNLNVFSTKVPSKNGETKYACIVHTTVWRKCLIGVICSTVGLNLPASFVLGNTHVCPRRKLNTEAAVPAVAPAAVGLQMKGKGKGPKGMPMGKKGMPMGKSLGQALLRAGVQVRYSRCHGQWDVG